MKWKRIDYLIIYSKVFFRQFVTNISALLLSEINCLNMFNMLNFFQIFGAKYWNYHQIKLIGTYIPNQNSGLIRISVFRDIRKIWKKLPISKMSKTSISHNNNNAKKTPNWSKKILSNNQATHPFSFQINSSIFQNSHEFCQFLFEFLKNEPNYEFCFRFCNKILYHTQKFYK